MSAFSSGQSSSAHIGTYGKVTRPRYSCGVRVLFARSGSSNIVGSGTRENSASPLTARTTSQPALSANSTELHFEWTDLRARAAATAGQR